MKLFLIGTLVLASLPTLAGEVYCNKGYVKIKRDLQISKQYNGNPEGEMRFDVGSKKRLTITAYSDNQEELESILKTINTNASLCLQVDPAAYGDYRLEEYSLSSLSALTEKTFTDHDMPRLLTIDMKNPFGLKH